MKVESKIRLEYVITDYLSANVGWMAFNILRYHLLGLDSQGFFSLAEYLGSSDVWLGQVFIPLIMMGVFYLSGFYNRVFVKSRLQIVMTTLGSVGISSLIVFFVMLVNDLVTDRVIDYWLLASLLGVLFFLVLIPRLVIERLTSRRVARGIITFPTLVVGSSGNAEIMEKRLKVLGSNPLFTIIGYVNASEKKIFPAGTATYDINDIERVCYEEGVINIILIPDGWSASNLLGLVNRLFPLDRHIYISPDPNYILTSRMRQNDVKGEPLIDVSKSDMPESTVNLKRVSDVAVSIFALIILAPIMAILAILVKLDSPGPVIYSQKRIGRHKSEFNIYKFRTMHTDAEHDGPALSSSNDHRVTKVGRVLRKYRLDELPQFWNVLRGDMSIVGPRPEREFFIRKIVEKAPYYTLLHQVRPGITSWGMVKYGYAEDVESMIERSNYDLLYIENISFAVDMKILLYTIHTVLTGKGV